MMHKAIHFNSYSLVNIYNSIHQKWNTFNLDNILPNEYVNETLDIAKQNTDTSSTMEPIFSEGILYKRGPGTSCRKLSKAKQRKRMSRVGFLARIRTFNGRKIILRQRRKGRRYLGAKW